ncbi:hypothetical protein DL765_010796 [Monosporascus sp. GIB2]|nr:hypothetical protein DL765_010796 [Monosporascus sp. GIB2]
MFSTLRKVAFRATLLSAAICTAQIDCSKEVRARLPLIYSANTTAGSWAPPPLGWIFGNWKVTWSSAPVYLSLHNFEVDLSPVFPQTQTSVNQMNDLSSYQLAGEKNLSLFYGVDTMRPENDGIYNFTSPALGSGSEYRLEILVWGYDTTGVGYKVTYENERGEAGPPALSIESRVPHGPTNETFAEIVAEIEGLGSEPLSTLARDMVRLTQNGGRDGIPAVCNAACVGGA